MSCVDFVTLRTVELDAASLASFGSSVDTTARTVSGELVGMFSAALSSGSPAPRAARNQPLTRVWTGDESGVGESEGNDVRLFVSAAGEGARTREALEPRFFGLTRTVLLLRLREGFEF